MAEARHNLSKKRVDRISTRIAALQDRAKELEVEAKALQRALRVLLIEHKRILGE